MKNPQPLQMLNLLNFLIIFKNKKIIKNFFLKKKINFNINILCIYKLYDDYFNKYYKLIFKSSIL